jgi:exosome complex RNA-binding protein Rrp42 (RNase PH superfamily)
MADNTDTNYGVIIAIDDPAVRTAVSGVVESALLKAGFLDVENLVTDNDGNFVEVSGTETMLSLLTASFPQVFDNRITITQADEQPEDEPFEAMIVDVDGLEIEIQ